MQDVKRYLNRVRKIWADSWILFADAVIAAVLLASILAYEYLLPHKGVAAVPFPDVSAAGQSDSAQALNSRFTQTNIKLDPTDWHKKFSDQFTDRIISTDTSYTSPDVAVHLTLKSYDSGIENEYGSAISYVLADIYLGDITFFRTGFAQDSYGSGIVEKLSDMSRRMGSVLAVNGDSYSSNQQDQDGTIIRNGTVYRANPTNVETCVLYWDGTIKIYSPGDVNAMQLIEDGAYQSWVFGPSLLDDNGKAKSDFLTGDYLTHCHPRTAIGYYEPGHYCLLAVNGRQSESRGMYLNEMAQLFERLGCTAAYNLDGGHSSCMTMLGNVVNHLYNREYEIPDGIFIMEDRQ